MSFSATYNSINKFAHLHTCLLTVFWIKLQNSPCIPCLKITINTACNYTSNCTTEEHLCTVMVYLWPPCAADADIIFLPCKNGNIW